MPVWPASGRLGLQQGVAGPELRLLDHGPDAREGGEGGADLVGHVADHDGRRHGREVACCPQDTDDHRLAADGVEHLRQLGLHPGALAGGQDHEMERRRHGGEAG